MDRIITVTGAGRVSIRPDSVRIDGSMEGRCVVYGDAVKASSESIRILKDTLEAAGFDKDMVRTTGFSVNASYRHIERGGVSTREFDGYEYVHGIRMTIPADGSVGRLLDALFGLEDGPEFRVSYVVSDPAVPMAEARKAAVRDAEDKAREVADATGKVLGEMVSISYVSSPCNFASTGRMLMSHGADITPDDVEFNDSVTIQWEIA